MERRVARRRRGGIPVVESLEGRQLLSGVGRASLSAGAADILARTRQNAQPAPQSTSPVTTRVVLATDQPRYEPGQPIRLVLTQSVVGRSPVNASSRPIPEVVVSQNGRELWSYGDGRGPTARDARLVTLRPGESREVAVTWDGRARDGSIVTGPVEVRAWVDHVEAVPRTIQIGPGATAPTRPTSPSRPDGPSAGADRMQQLRERQARMTAELRKLALQRLANRLPGSSLAPGPRRPGRPS